MKKNVIIAGLGNPGGEYEQTRHNIGFVAVTAVCDWLGISFTENKKCNEARYLSEAVTFYFLKPMEYMNLSGNCIARAMKQHAVQIQDVMVVHDEIDIGFADIRNKVAGGHAGHNGLRDIIDKTGSRDFHRLRIGVGRPQHPGFSVADYVLSRFHAGEQEQMPGVLKETTAKILDWMSHKDPAIRKRINLP